MSKTVWGYWDCSFCNNRKIRGDNEECPFCGHPRSADVKFYMDRSNIEYVSENKINDEPNWICPYCNTQNENHDDICEYCGASKTESKTDYFAVENVNDNNVETPLMHKHELVPIDANKADASLITRCFSNKKINLKHVLLYSGIGIAVVALIWFFVWFLTPVEHTATVNGFEWERQISIERLTTVDESGWTLPANARLQRTAEEIRSYEKVIDHYETKTRQVAHDEIVGYEEYVVGYDDLGNGQFRERTATRPIYKTYYETETYQEPVYRQEPIYDTKYYYEIDKYIYARSVKTNGTDQDPYWGEVTLASKEKEGFRTECYWIICDEYRTSLSFADWRTYNIGEYVIVTTNRTDTIVYSVKHK